MKTSSPQNNQYSSPCCLCTWTILQWVTALCLALPTLYLLYFPSGTRTTGLKIPERMGLYLGYLFVTTSSSLLSTDQASINVCSCGIFTLSFVTDGLLVLSFFWATRTQLSNYHRLPRILPSSPHQHSELLPSYLYPGTWYKLRHEAFPSKYFVHVHANLQSNTINSWGPGHFPAVAEPRAHNYIANSTTLNQV